MAKMTVNLPTAWARQLSKLTEDEPKKRVVYEGARVAADEIKKNTVVGPTGDLRDSVGITSIDKDEKGNHNAKVGFGGYDRNGVSNALKANVLESGSSRVPKRPFIRPTVNKSRHKIHEAMSKESEKIIKEIFKE